MATCIYCHQRKGKRTCPALQGSICSTCCGEHRLTMIDCPSGCVYLGGLSLVREGATGFSKAEYETAIQGLIAHCRGEADKSVSVSNERKNSGRKLLEKRLGSAIAHRADTVHVAAALRHSQPSREAPDAEQLEILAHAAVVGRSKKRCV